MAFDFDRSCFARPFFGLVFVLLTLSCGGAPPKPPSAPVATDQQGLLVWWGACADTEATAPKSDGRSCFDVSLEDRIGPWARLARAELKLDGVTIASWGDRPPTPPRFVPVFAGRILPGPHRLDVQLTYKMASYGAFAMSPLSVNVDAHHTWEQRAGQATDLVVATYEKGNVMTPVDQRPAVAFIGASDLAAQLLRGEGPAAEPLSAPPATVTEPQAGPWMVEARERIEGTSYRLRVLERGVRRKGAALASCVGARVAEVETLRGQFHGGAWREPTEAAALAARIIDAEREARSCR